jgi:chemotaxis protein CheX
MDANLINPFIESTQKVLSTMAQTESKPDKPYLKTNLLTWGAVTGIIGMAGDEYSGNLLISFDEPCILDIVSKMLMEQFTQLTPDVIDAVGEITNMITGGTKNLLSEQGMKFEMATPLVMSGSNIELKQLSPASVLVIPFETSAGKFVVEANLAKRKK